MMSNPLYRQLNGGNNNMVQMLQQFEEFRRNYRGNPKEEVERLIREGRITQQQLNAVQQPARMLYNMIKR